MPQNISLLLNNCNNTFGSTCWDKCRQSVHHMPKIAKTRQKPKSRLSKVSKVLISVVLNDLKLLFGQRKQRNLLSTLWRRFPPHHASLEQCVVFPMPLKDSEAMMIPFSQTQVVLMMIPKCIKYHRVPQHKSREQVYPFTSLTSIHKWWYDIK